MSEEKTIKKAKLISAMRDYKRKRTSRKERRIDFTVSPSEENDKILIRVITEPKSKSGNIGVDAVQEMIAASDSDQLESLFLQAARQDVSEQVSEQRSLVQVFVQDEHVFREIVETISSLENISLNLFEGKSAGAYLTNTALYADFSSNGETASYCILAIVERNLGNEVIRRIETITGSLLECSGVIVTIQELAYSAGSLEM